MTVFPVRSVVVGLAIAIATVPAEAQVCNGSAPFSNGLVRLGVGGGRMGAGFGGADGKPGLGLRVSLGAKQGAFGSVGASRALYSSSSSNPFIRKGLAEDTVDDAASGHVSFWGGYSIAVPASRKFELCPFAGLSNQSGPSLALCSPLPGGGRSCNGAGRGSGRAIWFGGSAGGLSRVSAHLSLVPFAGAAYMNSRITASGRSATDDYVEITAGLGIVFKRLTVRPALSVPMGLEEGSSSFGLEFAFNLGSKG
jgi:hypothetical protein